MEMGLELPFLPGILQLKLLSSSLTPAPPRNPKGGWVSLDSHNSRLSEAAFPCFARSSDLFLLFFYGISIRNPAGTATFRVLL